MFPEHGHLHISSFALFLIVLAILGFIGLLIAWGKSRRQAKLDLLHEQNLHQERMVAPPRLSTPETRYYGSTAGGTTSTYPPNVPRYAQNSYSPPAYVPSPAPVVVHNDGFGGSGFLTGMLMGEVMAGNHDHTTTVVHDSSPSQTTDSGSWDNGSSGVSYDSGSSSSSSSDSGGVDVSW